MDFEGKPVDVVLWSFLQQVCCKDCLQMCIIQIDIIHTRHCETTNGQATKTKVNNLGRIYGTPEELKGKYIFELG